MTERDGDRRRPDGGWRGGRGGSSGGRGRRSDRRDGERPDRRPRSAGGREDAQAAERPVDPVVDEDVTGRELDPQVRDDLATLSAGAAAAVARHMVMAGRLLDEDPELAYQHAMAARRRGSRVGVVREAAGVAAYAAGHFAEALAELRAARRLTGSAEYLPLMADSERGLGRPRRALDLAADPAATALEPAARIELLIVAAGARRDLGDDAAAAVSLQVPELRSDSAEPWVARLRYAYADALAATGRRDEAREWFFRAAEADADGETDAEDRLIEFDSGADV